MVLVKVGVSIQDEKKAHAGCNWVHLFEAIPSGR